MIHYTLTCDQGHGFDSWFQNAAAFESLVASALVSCPVCGAVRVEKSLMAPAVRSGRKAAAAQDGAVAPETIPARPNLSAPGSELEAKLAELRRQVEAKSEYVGMNFVAEARRIHDGSAPERSIYGEAKPEDARKLLEEGVPVAPLPFLPGRKVN